MWKNIHQNIYQQPIMIKYNKILIIKEKNSYKIAGYKMKYWLVYIS